MLYIATIKSDSEQVDLLPRHLVVFLERTRRARDRGTCAGRRLRVHAKISTDLWSERDLCSALGNNNDFSSIICAS